MSEPSSLFVTLYTLLLTLEHREERKRFLDYACRNDPAMRIRLENLLSHQDKVDDFFDFSTAEEPFVEETSVSGPPLENTTEGVGTKIGRYKLLERLGEGGCGVVYLAEQQEPVRRRVALKIIRLGMDTENVMARFEMERQSLALMDHPNIARIYDVGTTRTGRPFFVMQLVDGKKITDYCDAEHTDIPRRLKLFIKVCQAIQHAHQKGVIHRDIKPSNILIWENDTEAVPKIIDFGIAKAISANNSPEKTMTIHGQFVGTPAYMSPEQATGNGLDVDTRSDIFSLGSLLYELLTGRPPFDPERMRQADPEEIRHILRDVDPPEPSVAIASLKPEALKEIAAQRRCEPHKLGKILKGDLDRIVMKALEKDRKRRYGTADAFAADINRYLNCEPVSARPSGGMYRFAKLVRRNKVIYASGALVFVSLVTGLGTALWMFHTANHARDLAEQARANEVALREKAELGSRLTKAAVQLKYGHLKEADESIADIPPARVQPSLESAETFRTLGLWHAREGRWQEASRRFAALAYSITGVDDADSQYLSIELQKAAAAMCEARDTTGYEALRNMAVTRFQDTQNQRLAEQIVKACLLLPADAAFMQRLSPLTHCVSNYQKKLSHAEHFWRCCAVALAEYRKNNFEESLKWSKRAPIQSDTPSRDALNLSLRALAEHQLGRHAESRKSLASAASLISPRFSTPRGVFDTDGTWQSWLIARIIHREAEQLISLPKAGAGIGEIREREE
ncbi:MAG: serine/threonine-protein kinase [Luteolibacter sp.]